jgi:phage FluMu protein Com
MGMFDYVNYEAPCIKCGKLLTEFQSKDGECYLKRLEPKDVRRFYTSCDECKTWNEYEVKPQEIKINLTSNE